MDKKNKGGRPQIKIDWELAKKLANIQCNIYEISNVLGVSNDTLSRRCKSEFKIPLEDFMSIHKGNGRVALRRELFRRALDGKKGDACLIFSLKNWCGMADKVEQDNTGKIQNDVIIYETSFGTQFTPPEPKEKSAEPEIVVTSTASQ